MFLIILLFFVALVFFGVMGHISKASNVGCGYVTFYTLVWIGSVIWLCNRWSQLHGVFSTLGAILLALAAPAIIHLMLLLLKEFVVWALKGLGD